MNKKAISPLIATVILIAFTIAIAIIVTGALTSMTKTQTEQATKASACPGAALDILETNCNNDILTVVLLNAGQTDFKNFSITAKIGPTATIYTNSSPTGDSIISSGKAGTLQIATGANYNGTVSKITVSVGNCPGFSVSITNDTTTLGSCS